MPKNGRLNVSIPPNFWSKTSERHHFSRTFCINVQQISLSLCFISTDTLDTRLHRSNHCSMLIHRIHDRCLLLFVTFFKSPQASCSLAWSSKVVSTISLFGTGLQFEQDPGQHPDLILTGFIEPQHWLH